MLTPAIRDHLLRGCLGTPSLTGVVYRKDGPVLWRLSYSQGGPRRKWLLLLFWRPVPGHQFDQIVHIDTWALNLSPGTVSSVRAGVVSVYEHFRRSRRPHCRVFLKLRHSSCHEHELDVFRQGCAQASAGHNGPQES
jgi:hypothetical protein